LDTANILQAVHKEESDDWFMEDDEGKKQFVKMGNIQSG